VLQTKQYGIQYPLQYNKLNRPKPGHKFLTVYHNLVFVQNISVHKENTIGQTLARHITMLPLYHGFYTEKNQRDVLLMWYLSFVLCPLKGQ
jgi:hypothetical protein